MQSYLITIAESDAKNAAEASERLAARAAYGKQLGAALVDSGRMHPSSEGKRVWSDRVASGPFDGAIETYYVVRADDLDAATRMARECPGGVVDVRPVMHEHLQPRTDEAGKLFACGVLGVAPDEAAWTATMDNIQRVTSNKFAASFRGGLRLEAPTTGKRITKGHVIDGPFMEAKEVIGGLFFIREASLADAVAWAQKASFMQYGGLEIRELWRT